MGGVSTHTDRDRSCTLRWHHCVLCSLCPCMVPLVGERWIPHANTFCRNSLSQSGASCDASSSKGGMGAIASGVFLARGEQCVDPMGTSTQSCALVGAL